LTQHRWDTLDGFQVLAGWDRPLQVYFFQISRMCPSCWGEGETETGAECFTCGGRGEQFVFDNLAAREFVSPMGGMSLQQVEAAMSKYLTEWPTTVVPHLVADGVNNEGNAINKYDSVGTVKGIS